MQNYFYSQIYTWGDNSYGQLGLGEKADRRYATPQVIRLLSGVITKLYTFILKQFTNFEIKKINKNSKINQSKRLFFQPLAY